jgi:hypothetical protein
MRSIAIRELIAGVDAMDLDPSAKRQFRQLVRVIGAAHGFTWIERQERTQFAHDLLMKGVSRATIRERLIAHFDVSRPQAYRIISGALKLYQKRPLDETASGFNAPIENQ